MQYRTNMLDSICISLVYCPFIFQFGIPKVFRLEQCRDPLLQQFHIQHFFLILLYIYPMTLKSYYSWASNTIIPDPQTLSSLIIQYYVSSPLTFQSVNSPSGSPIQSTSNQPSLLTLQSNHPSWPSNPIPLDPSIPIPLDPRIQAIPAPFSPQVLSVCTV